MEIIRYVFVFLFFWVYKFFLVNFLRIGGEKFVREKVKNFVLNDKELIKIFKVDIIFMYLFLLKRKLKYCWIKGD